MKQPLRNRRDYGYNDLEEELEKRKKESVNKYLNVSPTELKRKIENTKDKNKKKELEKALSYWRKTVPGPFRGQLNAAKELLEIAKIISSL